VQKGLSIAPEFHEVWESNLDAEFDALLGAVAKAGGPHAILALDTEFPGFPYSDPRVSTHTVNYDDLRRNVDELWPIQMGVAVNNQVWTFNMRFDADVDAHTAESLAFLRAAGLDFPRHRTEGVNALALGRRLANSTLVGPHGRAPCWLTFSGSYDWAYLLKLVTQGRQLPDLAGTFDNVLSVYCPKRKELQDLLPKGSLEKLGHRHGVKRWGAPHTAGSDALLTLELFTLLGSGKLESGLKLPADGQRQAQWGGPWQNSDGWYPGFDEPWYNGLSGAWGDNMPIVGEDGLKDGGAPKAPKQQAELTSTATS
jgi:CCR4-NOT transcription complex subunit 7/8